MSKYLLILFVMTVILFKIRNFVNKRNFKGKKRVQERIDYSILLCMIGFIVSLISLWKKINNYLDLKRICFWSVLNPHLGEQSIYPSHQKKKNRHHLPLFKKLRLIISKTKYLNKHKCLAKKLNQISKGKRINWILCPNKYPRRIS
jgi:hypothetical protein